MKPKIKANQNKKRAIKEQAIILKSIDRISIKEYVKAIGNIIGPKSVKYIFRILNGRICIYLDNKDIVTNLTSQHNSVTINNTIIEIRPILVTVQRIILSNIHSIIPNSVIEEELEKHNIKLYSKIMQLTAGIFTRSQFQTIST